VADEVVLVDSGSSDRTCAVAREYGARVYSRLLDGLADQKNYAAGLASHDWLLSIDCDEQLSPELRSSILAWKQQSPDRAGSILRCSQLSGRMDSSLGCSDYSCGCTGGTAGDS
jgi:hypothetical protein